MDGPPPLEYFDKLSKAWKIVAPAVGPVGVAVKREAAEAAKYATDYAGYAYDAAVNAGRDYFLPAAWSTVSSSDPTAAFMHEQEIDDGMTHWNPPHFGGISGMSKSIPPKHLYYAHPGWYKKNLGQHGPWNVYHGSSSSSGSIMNHSPPPPPPPVQPLAPLNSPPAPAPAGIKWPDLSWLGHGLGLVGSYAAKKAYDMFTAPDEYTPPDPTDTVVRPVYSRFRRSKRFRLRPDVFGPRSTNYRRGGYFRPGPDGRPISH